MEPLIREAEYFVLQQIRDQQDPPGRCQNDESSNHLNQCFFTLKTASKITVQTKGQPAQCELWKYLEEVKGHVYRVTSHGPAAPQKDARTMNPVSEVTIQSQPGRALGAV
jgi:hypothetical protein